jgi:hypothetical protein
MLSVKSTMPAPCGGNWSCSHEPQIVICLIGPVCVHSKSSASTNDPSAVSALAWTSMPVSPRSGICCHFTGCVSPCVCNSNARSHERSGVGHQIGSPSWNGSIRCAPVGSQILTASSGAREVVSRGSVFHPKGYSIFTTSV